MAATKEISIDAALAAVLAELDFHIERLQATLKAFLGGQQCLALFCTGFGRSSNKRLGVQQLAVER